MGFSTLRRSTEFYLVVKSYSIPLNPTHPLQQFMITLQELLAAGRDAVMLQNSRSPQRIHALGGSRHVVARTHTHTSPWNRPRSHTAKSANDSPAWTFALSIRSSRNRRRAIEIICDSLLFTGYQVWSARLVTFSLSLSQFSRFLQNTMNICILHYTLQRGRRKEETKYRKTCTWYRDPRGADIYRRKP